MLAELPSPLPAKAKKLGEPKALYKSDAGFEWTMNRRVGVFAEGMVHVHYGKVDVIAWPDIESFSQSITHYLLQLEMERR